MAHHSLQTKLIRTSNGGGRYELIAITVQTSEQVLLIVNIYIAPSKSVPEFTPRILPLMEELVQIGQQYENVMIVGDFNLPGWDWDQEVQPETTEGQLFQLIDEHLAELGVSQIQKLRNRRGRILDLVLVTHPDSITDLRTTTVNFKEEDDNHAPLAYSINLGGYTHQAEKLIVKNKVDLPKLSENIVDIVLHSQMATEGVLHLPTSAIERTTHDLVAAASRCTTATYTTIPKWASKHPWLHNDTCYFQLRKAARKAYNAWWNKGVRNQALFQVYQAAKDAMVRRFNELKEKGHQELERSLNPDVNFFTYIKRSKGQSCIPPIMTFMGNQIKGVDRAKAFAAVFAENFAMDNPLVTGFAVDQFAEYELARTRVVDEVFTKEEIIKAIGQLSLKKDPGPHLIPAAIFIQNWEILSEWLCNVFNMIGVNKQFPASWKNAFIIPIPKKGEPKDPRNYRGIAIQSIVPKLYDKIITAKLYAVFKPLIDMAQHGFNNLRNIQTNHLEAYDYISTSLGEGFEVDAIFFDFSKAFDKLDHLILIRKLFSYGFDVNIITTIITFITGRTYTVKMDGEVTDISLKPKSGVPQGSHISPLLYLIYCNDIRTFIQQDCPNVQVLQYADDTKILLKIQSQNSVNEMQRAVNALARWAEINKIPLNNNKTQAMTFCRGVNLARRRYIINGEIIQPQDTIKDLGVHFDRKLNFVPHHSLNMKLARTMIGMAKRFSFHIQNPRFLVNIFRTYILPKIEFGHILWGSVPTRIKKVESLQSGVILFALRRNPDAIYQPSQIRRNIVGVNSIADRLQSQQFIVIIKILVETLFTTCRQWIIARQDPLIPHVHKAIGIADLPKFNSMANLCAVYNELLPHLPGRPVSIQTIKRILRRYFMLQAID